MPYIFKLKDPRSGHDWVGEGPNRIPVDRSPILESSPYASRREAERALKNWPADREYQPLDGQIVEAP